MPVDILQWLNSDKDYKSGVALYDKHGTSQVVKDMLKKHENDFTREKLFSALTAIQGAEKPLKRIKTAPVDPRTRPDILIVKEKLKGELYAQLNHYRSKAFEAKTVRTRYRYVKKVKELERQIQELWEELDYYDQHGQLMPKKKAVAFDNVLDMYKRLDLLTNYINRSKRSGDTQKVVKFMEEKNQLETILSGLSVK